jgi:hypothetical protein
MIAYPNPVKKRQSFNEQTSDLGQQQNPTDADSNGVFLLLDANEHLTVTQYFLSAFYLFSSILF